MPQPKSQNRLLEYELWCRSNRERSLSDIADELNVSANLVRKWKSQDKWDVTPQTISRKRGGQRGNKNATGNNGGAPTNNINAIRTGEFERILISTLSTEEMNLIDQIHLNSHKIQIRYQS